jgi:sugar phosphate isomerase/epimerase
MGVDFYRSMWGPLEFSDDISDLPGICADTVTRGYVGIETNPLMFGKNMEAARRIVEDHGLKFLSRAHTFGLSVADHLGWVTRCVEASHAFGTPHVIVQSGADYFDDGQIDEYFTATGKLEADSGLRIAHETHRGCILYSPWVTARVLDRFPDIWLASDYSHFVIVAERYLDTEAALLARFAPRVIHIDARVSTFESPQVADPRTDEEATSRFVAFWDEIYNAGALRTVVPEFGPEPYAPKDSADLDDVCQWMTEHLRERWS